MSELRMNLATREWIIYATDRAKRPEDFAESRKPESSHAAHSTSCPFCPGNEDPAQTPTLVAHDEGHWALRVLPNKYPALAPDAAPGRRPDAFFRKQGGFGYHEVVVETPRHDLRLPLMGRSDVARVLLAYRARYRAMQADARVGYVVVFKNSGPEAGSSLEHPHSQIIATPVVPADIRARVVTAIAHYDDSGECVYCRMLAEELKSGERVVAENDLMVAYMPFASYSPFHTWIFPRRHEASFADASDEEIDSMAGCLRSVLFRMHRGLGDPAYNLVVRSVPESSRHCQYYHWYISIVLRLTRPAGFELGSGMFINTALPEESARFLRSQPEPLREET